MNKVSYLIFIILAGLTVSCDKKNHSGSNELLSPSAIVIGEHDRKINKNPDRTTVAIAKGASLHTICSGTTIGISHVITAAHCVYDDETKKLKSDLTIVPELHMASNHKPAPRFFINKVFILKDYIQDIEWNGYTTYAASKDIAIIQVKEFKNNGYYFNDYSHKLRVVDFSAFKLNGQKLSLIGYTGGGNNTLNNSQYVQHFTCKTKGQRYSYTAFNHDCDTTPGSSGMGMVAQHPDGYGMLVGVHTGETSSGFNSAAFLDKDVLNEVKDKITLFKHDDLQYFKTFDYKKETDDTFYVGYQVRNNCSETVYVSLYYKHLNGSFYVKDPMRIEPGELKIFNTKTKDIKIKYHAKYSDGTVLNNYDVSYEINGETIYFQSLSFPNLFTDNELVICQ